MFQYLTSLLAKQTGLSLTRSETKKTGFSRRCQNMSLSFHNEIIVKLCFNDRYTSDLFLF